MPASQVTLIGRLEMASECVFARRIYLFAMYLHYVNKLVLSSFPHLLANQPLFRPTHPPSSFLFSNHCLPLSASLLAFHGRMRDGRTHAADADGPPKHESARGVPAAARFGNEFGPLDVAFPSLSRFPCVNIAALMILGAVIYHVNFWTS